MKKFIAAAICFLFLLCPAPARSETDNSVEESQIAPLVKGQSAPFDGVELNPSAAAQIIVDKDIVTKRQQAEIEKIVADTLAKETFKYTELKNSTDAEKKLLNEKISQDEEIIKKENSRWSRSSYFFLGTGVGIVVTTAATIVIATLASK